MLYRWHDSQTEPVLVTQAELWQYGNKTLKHDDADHYDYVLLENEFKHCSSLGENYSGTWRILFPSNLTVFCCIFQSNFYKDIQSNYLGVKEGAFVCVWGGYFSITCIQEEPSHEAAHHLVNWTQDLGASDQSQSWINVPAAEETYQYHSAVIKRWEIMMD